MDEWLKLMHAMLINTLHCHFIVSGWNSMSLTALYKFRRYYHNETKPNVSAFIIRLYVTSVTSLV